MLVAFWTAFVALFVIVEPVGAVPMVATLTAGRPRDEVRRIARRASVAGASVLVAFALLGGPLLRVMGIGPHAFSVAGGVLLLLTAIDMLRGKVSSCRCGPADVRGADRDDVAIVPIAIPLLAGPGAMATVMALVHRDPGAGNTAAVILAIAVTFAIAYPLLRSAALLQRLLGDAALTAAQRVLGLLVMAIAVEAIARGALGLAAGA